MQRCLAGYGTELPSRRPWGRGRWLGEFVRAVLLVSCLLALLTAAPPGAAWDSTRMLRVAQQAGGERWPAAQAADQALAAAAGLSPSARVTALNDFVNRRVEFVSDADNWGQVDYWSGPIETLARGRGDCEDYAIAKYFLLVAAGIPVSQLRLVYVRATLVGAGVGGVDPVQAHMVLAYYPGGPAADPLILDNLVPDILPAHRRHDLAPVFSFNSEGLWQGTQGTPAGDPVARLSRWRETLLKARAEGF